MKAIERVYNAVNEELKNRGVDVGHNWYYKWW
jgi:hypothetical protein